MKETPAPQMFLASSINKHRNDCGFGEVVAAVENGASRTLSRKFWQRKYFLENPDFARSALAAMSLFGISGTPIRKTDPVRTMRSKPRNAITSSSSRRKMEDDARHQGEMAAPNARR